MKFVENSEDEDKENDPFQATQTADLCMSTSKDTIHVIRLAAALQIVSAYIRACLTKSEVELSSEISVEYLRRGRHLYRFMAGQKAVFSQVEH